MHPNQADIHCPKCGYRPQPADRWACVPTCGTSWNTFWTRGMCPGCGKRWQVTQCPACIRRSPHQAWYHVPPRDEETESTADRSPAKAT